MSGIFSFTYPVTETVTRNIDVRSVYTSSQVTRMEKLLRDDIPDIPPAWKAVGFRPPCIGEWFISAQGNGSEPLECKQGSLIEKHKSRPRLIVEPTAKKTWVFQRTEEYRAPRYGEHFVYNGSIVRAGASLLEKYWIVKEIEAERS